jgi:hypothetical protein
VTSVGTILRQKASAICSLAHTPRCHHYCRNEFIARGSAVFTPAAPNSSTKSKPGNGQSASTASSSPANLTKPFWRADETVFWDSEGVLKPTWPINDPDQQWGSIMWAFIINLVYGPSCEKYLADLARHRHSWI